MKKALDYVSDYQLKSACKDAICIAPSKVTQMIFAVLEDLYHHIVLTHSCKLVSFFTYIIVLQRQCAICWRSKCQVSVKSTEANNSYSGFCEVTPKHFSFKSLWITLDTTFYWNLALWLPTDNALWTQNYVRISCCLLELRKCTVTKVFTCVTPSW